MLADYKELPVLNDEIDRLYALLDLDLDYSAMQNHFKDLTKLAAKVAGTDISMINIVDMYTQWTVSSFGLDIKQMPREDSVCQYTIAQNDPFEVSNLLIDGRFKDKFYVTDAPNLRYYYGLPLQTSMGDNIGALCVLDTQQKDITPEKNEMLKLIADEVVNRLQSVKSIEFMREKLYYAEQSQKQMAHDVREPISAIMGLARIISEQGHQNTIEETLQFMEMIQNSSNSLLQLADDILRADTADQQDIPDEGAFTQLILKERLHTLYAPQAYNKNIEFKITTNTATDNITFSRSKLLQIVGNIVSNAIKFTPVGGTVSVQMHMLTHEVHNDLHITVKDNGVGISNEKIATLMNGRSDSTEGTGGEQGYGFGLNLVKHLIDKLNGQIYITSKIGVGTLFDIILPQSKQKMN